MGRAKLLLLVAEVDLERTSSLRRELVRAGFELRSSVQSLELGETAQQAWARVLADAHCVLVVWSRSSVHEPSFVGCAEDARLLGVSCPLLLDGMTRDELPVGHQSAVCGDLTGWNGSHDQGPFPEIARRARALQRARTQRRIVRAVRWAVVVGAILALGVYVAREQARTPVSQPESAKASSARAPAKNAATLDPPQERAPEPRAKDAGQAEGQPAAHAHASQDATPARAPRAPAARRAPPPARASESTLGPNWIARAKQAGSLCQAGDGDACDELGWQRELGHGVRQDFAAALVDYERGCTLGAEDACYNAARMYEHGLGTVLDAARARQRLRRGCALSSPSACHAERTGQIDRAPQPPARIMRRL